MEPEYLHAAAKELSTKVKRIGAGRPRQPERILLLGELARDAELLKIRERDGLCTACAGLQRDVRGPVAAGIGAALGVAAGELLRGVLKASAPPLRDVLSTTGNRSAPSSGGRKG